MKKRPGWTGAVLALILALAGCSAEDDPNAEGTPTSTSTPTPTSTATKTLSPQERLEKNAKADAQATLTRYFRVLDQIGQDPEVPLSRLKKVAIGSLLLGQEARFQKWRQDGWVKTGSIEMTDMRVDELSLGNSDPAVGKVPYVVLTVCTDASDVDVVDRSGKSVVLDSRPELLTTRYSVANHSWNIDPRGGWRVESGKDQEIGSCTL